MTGTTPGSRSQLPVVIVDDHDLISEALATALRERALPARRLPVRSEAYVRRALSARPTGLVLLDLDLGRDDEGRPVDGLNMIAELRAAGWRVIILSGTRSRARVAAAIAAGALGYVPKSAPLTELVRAVVEAVDGRQIMTETERRHWTELHRRAQAARAQREEMMGRLTSREREVLDLLAQGLRVATIAERFVVSEATVRTQVKSILRKLEVTSQLEAVALLRSPDR
jgi:DNA-binding NarL/FixJ family response regulator